jgi:hypothetical protein
VNCRSIAGAGQEPSAGMTSEVDCRHESEVAGMPAKAGFALAGDGRSPAPPAGRVKDLLTGAVGALRVSLTRPAGGAKQDPVARLTLGSAGRTIFG